MIILLAPCSFQAGYVPQGSLRNVKHDLVRVYTSDWRKIKCKQNSPFTHLKRKHKHKKRKTNTVPRFCFLPRFSVCAVSLVLVIMFVSLRRTRLLSILAIQTWTILLYSWVAFQVSELNARPTVTSAKHSSPSGLRHFQWAVRWVKKNPRKSFLLSILTGTSEENQG